MQIQNNIIAKNTSRNQGIVRGELKKSLEKLSSGYRINHAGDDAAGLAVSEGMRSQINGLDQAVRNVNDGIGMTNTGEGALQEVHSMLHRLKTLAIQAANGTYSDTARINIDAERQELLNEMDRIGSSTDFNSIPLFDNDAGAPTPAPEIKDNIMLQIGHTVAETMPVARFYMSKEALELDSTSFLTSADANTAVGAIDNAIQAVTAMRASLGASQTHLQHTSNSLGVTKENMTALESGIRDTDMAKEITAYTSFNIISQASDSVMLHANSLPQNILKLLQN